MTNRRDPAISRQMASVARHAQRPSQASKALFRRENLAAVISLPTPLLPDLRKPRNDMENCETPTDAFIASIPAI